MKTILIPRVDHEVYFIPFNKTPPDKKQIRSFLISNHPYYNSKFRTDCRQCTICGKTFSMITVVSTSFHYNWKRIFPSRILTCAAILSVSSYASISCTIRCSDEIILFNENPESIPLNKEVKHPLLSDVSFNSEKEILDLARKEKIHISLFTTRWRKPLCISLAVLCIVACASFSTNKKADVLQEPVNTPVILPSNESLSDQFWNSFTEEIRAVSETEGFIEEYSYSANREPSHILNIRESDPGILSEKLLKTLLFQNISIPSIQYLENSYFFTLHYSSASIIKERNGFNDVYRHIRTIEEFCTNNNYTVTAVEVSTKPLFNICISDKKISEFMSKLYPFCVTNKIALDSIDLQHSQETSTISAQISFADAIVNEDVLLPTTTVFFSVFNIEIKKSLIVKKTSPLDETVQIGKIQTNSNTSFVFVKSDSGKITIKKEGKK